MFNIKKVKDTIVTKSVIPTTTATTTKQLGKALTENIKLKQFIEDVVKSPDALRDIQVVEQMTKKTMETMPTSVLSTNPKVQAILEKAEQDTLKREQAVIDYSKLSKLGKVIMKGKDITSENVARAKMEATLHERAEPYRNEITLLDWNKGLEHVEQKIDSIEAWAKAAAQRNNQLQKSRDPADYVYGISDIAPVHFVEQGYYLLFDNGRVYLQTDNPDDKRPVVLAKLRGESRGSLTTTHSYDKPDYLGFDDYKMILETKPSYQSLRKAYDGIRNDKIQLNFALATKLFN